MSGRFSDLPGRPGGATATQDGLMTAEDKALLDSLVVGGGGVTSVSPPLTLVGGVADILPATTTTDGSMSAADKAKLDGIPAGGGAASATYVHNQLTPATTWTITHSMGQWPAVAVVDSGGNVVSGDIAYVSANQVRVTFTVPFGGTAYLNV